LRAPSTWHLGDARLDEIPRTALDVEFDLGGKLAVEALPSK
jgi:hypothetical protein